VAIVVGTDGLDQIVQALRAEGRRVLGPIVRGGVITHDEIDSVHDLPSGWTEEQEGGVYRLEETGTDELFGWATPSSSWKQFLYPARTLLIRAHKRNGSIDVETPVDDAPPMAFFGIRSCDLASLGVLDRVFLDPAATDPTYAARRDVFVVAVACGTPGNTCFCASMDTGPDPRSGYDLAVTEMYDEHHEFLVRAGSDRGEALLATLDINRPAEPVDEDRADAIVADAATRMGRHLDHAHALLAGQRPEHERWDDIAERCLACGNCTMVCPTCFCSTTEDTTDLSGENAERWRVWDSCFTLGHSYLHGGSVRATTASRYRQWLLHKLVTWHDQYDTSGCVGCGRCITWCPVGIDLTAEIAALAADQTEASPA